jgi:zinc and cadmium transporter
MKSLWWQSFSSPPLYTFRQGGLDVDQHFRYNSSMNTFLYILLFTFIATIASLFLVGTLLLHKNLVNRISFSLVSFAAGALLATAFLDTLPEAQKGGGEHVLLWVLLSIAGFFIIERLFLVIHHHEDDDEHQESMRLPTEFLLFGDGLHNFIDGASIAASFLVSIPLGIITSIAVFVHEIPHELGDFGILLHKGMGRKKVLGFNLLTGLASLAGAVIAYHLGEVFRGSVPLLLAITTANFIYLSATDLLPEIHHHSKKHPGWQNTLFFLLGILLVYLLVTFLHE